MRQPAPDTVSILYFMGRMVSGEWCQEPFSFTLGFQPEQNRQFSIHITLQIGGQLAQLPSDQAA
jgi:hypothetical protein